MGAPGLGGNVYIGSERMINGVKETNCNLLAMKSKVSKRTIPAHEMMAKPHQANMVKEVAKSIEFRLALGLPRLLVIMGGDSVCTACLFNPEIEIRNVLIKGAINTTKQRMKEILEILPEATIHLTRIAGDKNTADAATKLHSNPVRVLNSDTYRHGPKELLMIDGEEHTLATVLANLASLVAIGISNSLGPIISQALDTQIFRFIITGASIAPSLEYACAVILLILASLIPR